MYGKLKLKFLIATFISFLILGSFVGIKPVLGEEVLGTWCFKPQPDNRVYNQLIKIKKTGYGSYVADVGLAFGFSERYTLNQTAENVFEVFGGANKEGYRVTPDGNLEFFNMFETVGVANKILEDQDEQDCFY